MLVMQSNNKPTDKKTQRYFHLQEESDKNDATISTTVTVVNKTIATLVAQFHRIPHKAKTIDA